MIGSVMLGDLDTWQRVLSPAQSGLRTAAASLAPQDLAGLARLRREWPADCVAVALELAATRVRASRKFPDLPDIVADREGLEQATSALVGDYKAERFASLQGIPAIDLCAGIGGDTIALAKRTPVEAYEIDPIRAWMAETNSRAKAHVADVTSLPTRTLTGACFHADPARRVERSSTRAGHRRHALDDATPGREFIATLLAAQPTGALKLGPGTDRSGLGDLPAFELEYVSEYGRLVQAIAWFGELTAHAGLDRATLLPKRLTFCGTPIYGPTRSGIVDRYLYVAEPALERAKLVDRYLTDSIPTGTRPQSVIAGLGLWTTDTAIDDPWFRRFEVRQTLPWRPKRIRAWLRDHDAGRVVVKTRGKVVDANRASRELSGGGELEYTVFAVRIGAKQVGIITHEPEPSLPA